MSSPQAAQAPGVGDYPGAGSSSKRSVFGYLYTSLCIVLFAEIAVALYSTRFWPLFHDAPLMHYCAFLIGRGRVPYRDFLDMNMPGSYLSSLLAIHVFGPGDMGWRLYDFAFLLAGIAAVWIIAKPAGRLAFALASSMLVAAHLGGGAADAGQRDFQVAIFELLACAFLLVGLRQKKALWFAVCGLACGVGATIKPPALLFAAAFGAVLLVERELPVRSRIRFVILIAVGSVLPWLIVLAYLAKVGALPAFFLACKKFVPLYAGLANPSFREMTAALLGMGLWKFEWLVRIPFESFRSMLLVLLVLALGGLSKVASQERRVLAVGAVCGVISFYAQVKGYRYHLYPLFFFFLIYLCLAVVPSLQDARLWKRAVVWMFVLGWTFAAACAHSPNPWGNLPAPRSNELIAEIASLRAQGHDHGIQMMDQTMGGFDAMYRLRLEQATGVIYDFQFFNKERDPYVQLLRSSWLEEMRRAQPDLIVMSIQHWPQPPSFDRLKSWPEFEKFLSESYHLERQTAWYRIYVRKSVLDSTEASDRTSHSPLPAFRLVS